MKSKLLALTVAALAFAVLPVTATAQNVAYQTTGPIPLLSAVSATGAGTGAKVKDGPAVKVGAQLTVVSGTLSTIACDIQGSNDGTKWFTIGTISTATDGTMVFIVDKPVLWLRANLTTLTGTSPVVTVKAAAVVGGG